MAGSSLTFKRKPETEKELAHVDTYINGEYVGYYIKNSSTLAVEGENWNFCPDRRTDIPYFYTRTVKDMEAKLRGYANE